MRGSKTTGGRTIVDQMLERYASCRTYQDTGSAATTYYAPCGEVSWYARRPFSTRFERPHNFLFEFMSHNPQDPRGSRYVIWRRGSLTRTWWDMINCYAEPLSLGSALGGAAGVSCGVSRAVPQLLLPSEIIGRRVSDFDALFSLGGGHIDGTPCYRIAGQMQRDEGKLTRYVEPTILWIENGTFLLRRVEEYVRSDRYARSCITDYSPCFDKPIPDIEFDFRPEVASDESEDSTQPSMHH